MRAYFGERGCEFDQASAILDSNSEEAWRETKMRPREWELGGRGRGRKNTPAGSHCFFEKRRSPTNGVGDWCGLKLKD